MDDENTPVTPTETPKPTETKGKSWFARHKVLTLVIVVIVIAAIASSSSDKNNTTTPPAASPGASSSPTPPPAEAASLAKIGQAVRDGKFEFTVNKLTCGETSVGSQYLNATAQGQYCRVNVTVKNIGNEAQTLSHSDQYAYNAAGQKFSADSTAAIYADSGSANSTWYNDVNPGNTVTGDIFFDVPKDVTPNTIELHDSAFSGGVKVSLQ